ncbi:MAG: 1-deoxy-D-xylulose-5-phosphate synthase [Alphaproteobacteria bacterium]
MEKNCNTPILNQITSPDQLKSLSLNELQNLASEVRSEVVNIVSKTGGHLGANLGIVELTLALHKVFDMPNDKIIWDVGHQCYPHKILTGRRKAMEKLRQQQGPSGFPKRDESPYDTFGAGHSSTSISAGLGIAEAFKCAGANHDVVSVIGDGSLTAGMAFEALNHAGELKSKLIVILNDNDMSIDKPTGALSHHLSKITSTKEFKNLREAAKTISSFLPGGAKRGQIIEEIAREIVTGEEANIFNAFGFLYFGPVDGHDLSELIPILENLKKADYDSPILLHVKTIKGKGYEPAELASDRLHGVTKFNPENGKCYKNITNALSWTDIFSQTITDIAQKDHRVIGITAAMPTGTGLKAMQDILPHQVYDVGIAEQHAVTFAAGMATEGFKPFVAIYSTFLQRAWDQLIHDVALQKLPVRFMVDRAGYVGADGPTHAGIFDLTMLASQPDFVVMAPSSGRMLKDMIYTAYSINDRPSAIRYPRGNCDDSDDMKEPAKSLEIGKGQIIQQGQKVAIISVGDNLKQSLQAVEILKENNITPTIADACFVAPLDTQMLDELALNHELIITVEDNGIGGFGSLVSQYLLNSGKLDNSLKLRTLIAPKEPIAQGDQAWQLQQAAIGAQDIVDTILKFI